MSESRSIGSLIVKLVAEGVGAYKADVDGAASATDKMTKLSKQLDDALAAQTKQVKQADSAMQQLASATKMVAGAFTGIVSAQNLIQAADAVTQLNNQLRLSSNSAAEASKAYGELFSIAQQSRVSFTELGTTYAAIARNGKELGISQTRLLDVTKSISQAMTIGGGSAASMQAALVQLGQGLSSGTLRGEELNSIMEQTPRLAKAIADGLGVPIGALRKLGEAGELTSQQVIGALEKAGPALAKEMESATLTVGQAFTMLGNSTTRFVGEADKASGASLSLASAMKSVSASIDTAGESISNNKEAFSAVAVGLAGAATVAGMGALAVNIGKVTTAVRVLGVAMAANPVILALSAIAAAGGALYSLSEDAKKSAKGMAYEIDALNERIAKTEKLAAAGVNDGSLKNLNAMKSRVAQLRQELAVVASAGMDTRAEDARLAAHTEKYKASEQALKAFTEAGDKYLSKSAKNQATLNKEIETGQIALAAGAISADDYAKRINDVRASFAKNDSHAKTISEATKGLALYNDLMAQSAKVNADFTEKQDKLTAAQKAGNITMDEYKAAMAVLVSQQPYMVQQTKQLADETKAADKAAHDITETIKRLNAEDMKRIDALSDARREIAAYVAATEDASDALAFETGLVGQNADARRAAIEQYRIEADLKSKIAAIDADPRYQIDEAARQKAIADVRVASARTAATASGRVTLEAWNTTYDRISEGLTDAIMTAGKDGGAGLRDFLEAELLTKPFRMVIQAMVQPIAGAMTNALVGGAGSSAGGGIINSAMGSMIGQGATLGAMGTAFGEGFMATLGGSSLSGGSAAAILSTGGAAGAGTMGMIGAAAPYVLAGLAVLKLLSGPGFISAADSGRARIDYTAAGVGGAAYSTTGDATQIATATKNTTDLAKVYFDTAAALGVKAIASAWEFGTNTGKEGSNPMTVIGVNAGKGSYSSGEIASGDTAALQLASSRAVLTALQASELPDYLKTVFNGLTASTASQDQINAALQFAGTLKTVREALLETREPAQILADSIKDSTSALGTTAETFKTDFVKAIDGGLTQDALAKWQALGGYLAQATANADALAKTNQSWQDKLDVLTGKATDRSLALRDATDDSTRAIMRQVYAQEDLKKAQTDAMDAVTKSVDAAKTAATKAYDTQAAAIQKALDPVAESIGKLQSLSDTLKSTLDNMKFIGSEGLQRTSAQAQISAALATARAGGSLPLDGQLNSALSTVAQPSDKLFGSFDAYARDFYRTANDIAALSDLTGKQLTADETTQGLLQAQLDNAKTEFDTQIQYLDAQAEMAQTMLDTANGTLTATLSVKDAIDALAAVLNTDPLKTTTAKPGSNAAGGTSMVQGGPGLGPGQTGLPENWRDYGKYADHVSANLWGTGGLPSHIIVTDPDRVERLDQIANVLDNYSWADADKKASAQAIYDQAQQYGVSMKDIAAAAGYEYKDIQSLFASAGIPAFVSGGYHRGGLALVGEDGPELVDFAQPAQIYPAGQTRGLLGGRDDDALLAKFDAMLSRLERIESSNADIATSNRVTQKAIVNVTRGGDAMVTDMSTSVLTL